MTEEPQTHRRRRGRPASMAAMTPVSVRLSDEDYARLYVYARAWDLEVSVVIRQAIRLILSGEPLNESIQ